jgi:hypothetical protein
LAFFGAGSRKFGTPFDTASTADLASGRLKDYKVYIFCNLHFHTPEKDRLVAGLRARGRNEAHDKEQEYEEWLTHG